MERLVREHGEFIFVTTPDGRFKVPRHYIALHGLKTKEIPDLGFEKVEDA